LVQAGLPMGLSIRYLGWMMERILYTRYINKSHHHIHSPFPSPLFASSRSLPGGSHKGLTLAACPARPTTLTNRIVRAAGRLARAVAQIDRVKGISVCTGRWTIRVARLRQTHIPTRHETQKQHGIRRPRRGQNPVIQYIHLILFNSYSDACSAVAAAAAAAAALLPVRLP
jgi:hypothetical protein